MINYYEILEIAENANLDEIKASYKRLAKKFHPDINPSLHAEETFKTLVLAYNTLSNPISRSKFDSILSQQRLAKAQAYAKANKPYPAYSYHRNQNQRTSYKYASPVDKKRERLGTLYAIGIIGSVALVIYLVTTMINIFEEKQVQNLIATAEDYQIKAEILFSNGNQQAALLTVDSLKLFVRDNNTIEQLISKKIEERKRQAAISFNEKEYRSAIWGMLSYMQYTGTQDHEMLFDLAIAYRYTKDLEKATFILNKLLNNNYRRIYTMSLMAEIYLYDLENTDVAITYYEMALSNIKAGFIATYGNAYRLFVSEEKTPYIYKKIYRNAATVYFDLGQYEKARKLLEWVIFFEPENAHGYELLAKTYQQLQQKNNACKVLRKAIKHNIDLTNLNISCNG